MESFESLLAEITQPTLQRDSLQFLPIEFLQRGQYQPRQEFNPETLQELAESIKTQGIIQPIIVRKLAVDKFEIIAGERRWRAAQLAGLDQVPVVIKLLDEKAAMTIALIENIQREDLNPLEEAEALKKLLENFAMTHQQLADAVGKSRAAVSNFLRLLDLPEQVKVFISQKQISMGHARALLTLDCKAQLQIINKIIQKNLSVRATELLVKQAQFQQKNLLSKIIDRDTLYLQQQLSEKLNAKVEIIHKKNGSGQLTIKYASLEELDGILQQLD